MARFQREVAWRVFAQELNDSDLELEGEGERAPSYVVSPLGAKVNRLLCVGVLTRTEPVNPDSDMWRGQVSDPTGVFHVYAGQYQPEAAAKLKELDPPCFVAVVGKSRTYRPEEGRVLVSVTPEMIKEVDSDARDRWVLETARHTRDRIQAVERGGDDPDREALVSDGVRRPLSEGVTEAVPHYGVTRLDDYRRMIRGTLEYLVSGSSSFAAEDAATTSEEFSRGDQVEPEDEVETSQVVEETVDDADEPTEEELELEETAFELIEELDEGKGAPWEDVLERMVEDDATETQVEEALNSLMDKGRIYEPILGRLKPS